MGKVRDLVEFIANEAPKSDKIKESVKKWISTYDGKVIGFRINGSIESSKWEERFHLIIYFKDDENLIMKVRTGEYPSPEVIFCFLNDIDGVEVFKNPGMLMKLIRAGKAWIMANLNEGLQFSSSIISRDPDFSKKLTDIAS